MSNLPELPKPADLIKLAIKHGATVKDLGSVWIEFDAGELASFVEEAVKQERERYDELFAKYNEVCVEVARLKFALPPLDDAIRQQGD